MKKINTCNDNIFALSTPVGGAIAVIRASGSGVLPVLREIFSGRIEHRQLNYGKITDRIEPDGGQGEERKENDTGALAVLDEAMAVYFRAPHSYTGEDMFELNLHGSYSVVSAVSRALTRRGMRLAEAGEFTKRAFLNGKMDLVQADAVMDLINAETRRGASAALEQLEGGLSRRIGAIEEKLLDFASELAAAMDYPEEMEDEVLSAAPEVLNSAISRIRDLIDNGNCNKIIREGAKLAILGRPNVGKSDRSHCGPAECRKIQPPKCTDECGTCNRYKHCGHNTRCFGRENRFARFACSHCRYGGHSRNRRCG